MRSSFFQAIFFSALFLIITWGSFQLSFIENLEKKNLSLTETTTHNKGGIPQINQKGTVIPNQLTSSLPSTTEQRELFTSLPQPQTEQKTTIEFLLTATQELRHCPPPGNWNAIFIQPGDTITSLSRKYELSPNQLLEANCLKEMDIAPGKILYVPSLPTTLPFTSTPTPCIPPIGWVLYTVQTGDTLTSLSLSTNSTLEQILRANCLIYSSTLRVGQQIYLPFLPFTPVSPTRVIPWWTITPSNPIIAPTFTPFVTNTNTSIPFPSETPSTAAMSTSIPTNTSDPMFTVTPGLLNATTPAIQQNAYPSKSPKP